MIDFPLPVWRTHTDYNTYYTLSMYNAELCSSGQLSALWDHRVGGQYAVYLEGPFPLAHSVDSWLWSQNKMTEQVMLQVSILQHEICLSTGIHARKACCTMQVTDSSGVCGVDSNFLTYSTCDQDEQREPGSLETPLDIDSFAVVCANNRLVYKEYLSDCTSNADCSPEETCLAPHWQEHKGLCPSGYVSGTACASDLDTVKTFCFLDSNCTAVVAESGLSAPDLNKACLYHGQVLPMEQSANFTTFTKPPVQHIGHCVRHAMLEVPAPAPAGLREITKASLKLELKNQPTS